MAAHTPGPWKEVSDGESNFYGFIADGTWLLRAQQNGELSTSEQSANARLIAAAPEMLEALIACDEAMEYMSEYCIPIDLPEKIKAAIKKASGE